VAPLRDLGRVIRAVHAIVEIGDVPRSDRRQRKRYLACRAPTPMSVGTTSEYHRRGRCRCATCSQSRSSCGFGVALRADCTRRGKIGQRHVDLTLQPLVLRHEWSCFFMQHRKKQATERDPRCLIAFLVEGGSRLCSRLDSAGESLWKHHAQHERGSLDFFPLRMKN
jgi:hypothetical protein